MCVCVCGMYADSLRRAQNMRSAEVEAIQKTPALMGTSEKDHSS